MYKVSKINPKDTTLDEIHAIQEKLYKKEKNWTWEQQQKHYNEVIKQARFIVRDVAKNKYKNNLEKK